MLCQRLCKVWTKHSVGSMNLNGKMDSNNLIVMMGRTFHDLRHLKSNSYKNTFVNAEISVFGWQKRITNWTIIRFPLLIGFKIYGVNRLHLAKQTKKKVLIFSYFWQKYNFVTRMSMHVFDQNNVCIIICNIATEYKS